MNICFGVMVQAHIDALSKLLEGKVSIDPLSVAIQEFSLVAKEVADEAKVGLFEGLFLFFVTPIHILMIAFAEVKGRSIPQK